MKSIIGLFLVPLLLANSALGNSIDDALNSKLLGTLISSQSPVESAATMGNTSPLASVASMAPMGMEFAMPYMRSYGYDFPMPYSHPVTPYMPAGAPFSPYTPYMSQHPYSVMGMPAISPLSAFPAYASANPLMSSLLANQIPMPIASASTYGYF